MSTVGGCGECTFWAPDGESDGLCRRGAPPPTNRVDQIAHWPLTHKHDRCGDGAQRGPQTARLVSCGECRFWRTNPGGGLDPLDRLDARRDWWDVAGYCVRHAPGPSSNAGNRGFWRATHHTDACGEGEPS